MLTFDVDVWGVVQWYRNQISYADELCRLLKLDWGLTLVLVWSDGVRFFETRQAVNSCQRQGSVQHSTPHRRGDPAA